MIDNINDILNMAVAKLKEKYGADFKFEEGDEFVFTLKDGVLILSYDDRLKVKIVLEEAIPLDADFSAIGGDVE